MQRGDAHEHVAHVADAGIADDVLQVVLRQGGNCPVYDVHRAQADEHRHPNLRAQRREQHAHLDDAECAQLHQHAGVEHTDAGGRGHVAVGRPGVEGPQTRQGTESHREEGEHPHLRETRDRSALLERGQFVDVEGRVSRLRRCHVQGQYPDPDQDAAGDEHQHQLHRAVFLGAQEGAEVGAAAPHADEQVHGQHGQLVEEEQEEQVAHHENAIHARAQRQQQHEEVPCAPGDGLADQHRAQQHDAVQQHQGRADAVEPEVQRYVDRMPDPVVRPHHLDAAGSVVVAQEHDDRDDEADTAATKMANCHASRGRSLGSAMARTAPARGTMTKSSRDT